MNIRKSRWVTLILQIIIGSATCFSYIITVFIGPLGDKFGWAAGTILFAFTLSMWVGTPANFIGGWLRDKFGCKKSIVGGGIIYGLALILSGVVSNVWVFVILQGIVAPLSMFICYIAALANLGVLFPDRRGAITGLYVGGYSLGSAALAPIAAWFIAHFPVGTAIVIEGVIYGIIVIVCGLFIIDPTHEEVSKQIATEIPTKNGHDKISSKTANSLETGPQVPWQKVLTCPAYYLIELSFIFVGIAGFVVMSNGAMIAEAAIDASPAFSAWVVTIINLAVGVGGFIFGYVADKITCTSALMILAIINVASCLLFVICGMNNVPAFLITVIFLGIGCGGSGCLLPVITMDTFGEKFFGINMGLASIQTIIATLVGPQLTVRFDIFSVFFISGICSLIGLFVLFITKKSIQKLCRTWVNEKDNIIGVDTSVIN